jgi:hypothetical protein
LIGLANNAPQLCVDQHKTLDAILVGLENIAGLIHRCTLYELLYLSEDSDASKNLEHSMLLLYIAILKFLAKAVDKLKGKHSHPTGCCRC